MATCVGCGLEVVDGILRVQLVSGGGLLCDPATGLSVDFPAFPEVICPDNIVGTSAVQTSPQGSGLPQALSSAGSYGYLNDNSATSIHICNTTDCTVAGLVFVQASEIYFDVDAGFIGGATLQVNINNGGFGTCTPDPRQTCHNNDAASALFQDINLATNLYVSLAAGACVDYQWNLLVSVNTGTGDLRTDSSGPKFVTRWSLAQVGCC